MVGPNLTAQQHYETGVAARKRNDPATARHHLRAAVDQDPGVARFNGSLGTFLLQQGEAQGALPFLLLATLLDPEHPGYRNNLSACQSRCGVGAVPAPIGMVLRAAAHEEAHVACELGNAALARGNLEQAVVLFERASLHDPDSARYSYKLAAAFDKQAQPANALPHFERAVTLDPGGAAFQNGLGVCLLKMGQTARARVHFERAIRFSPENKTYRDNLAMIPGTGASQHGSDP